MSVAYPETKGSITVSLESELKDMDLLNQENKILTWNINRNKEAFEYIIKLVQDYSDLIICLQEVCYTFIKKLNENNIEFKKNAGITQDGKDEKDWGTFIMWGKNYKKINSQEEDPIKKLEIEYNKQIESKSKDSQNYYRKQLGTRHTPFIKLRYKEKNINVMSVHLPQNDKKRIDTLTIILNHIKKKGETHIVAGDFNLTPEQINNLDNKYKKYFKEQINSVKPTLTIDILDTLHEKQGFPESSLQKKQITCSKDKLNNLVTNNITAWGWGNKEEKRQNKIKFCDRLDYIISNKDIFTGNNVPTIQDNDTLKTFYNNFNYKAISNTDDNHDFVDHAPVEATFTIPEYTFKDSIKDNWNVIKDKWDVIIGILVIFGIIYITLYPDSDLAKLINSYGNNQHIFDEQYGGQSNRYVKCRKDYIALKYM
jgi:endonuclease/exonuclease/phosphatase family metal-dependent hydrolase